MLLCPQMFIFRGGEKYHFKAQEGTSKMTNKIKNCNLNSYLRNPKL